MTLKSSSMPSSRKMFDFWLLCGGEYKFLLRSAWIVLATTTLIDISAIIAYWQLAPKSVDSKPGLRLSLLLLVAVLFLYFFAVLLSCFIIIKLSPKKRESSRESATLNSSRIRNDPVESFGPFSQSFPYSDGFRRVPPNNAPPPPPPRRNPHEQALTEVQYASNRRANIAEIAARSRMETWNSHTARNTNLNDGKTRRNSDQSYSEMVQVANVPELVITGPEYPVPMYEYLQAQPSQFSSKIQSDSSTCASPNTTCQNRTSILPRNHFYSYDISRYSGFERPQSKLSMHASKVESASTSNNTTIKPVASLSETYLNRSIAYQCYEDERTLEMSMHQAKSYSRSAYTHFMDKPVFSRSESCINSCKNKQHGPSEKQTLEMSMHQAKLDSRVINSYLTVKPVSSRSLSYVNRCNTNESYVDERQTLKASMQQTKSDSIKSNSNPNIKMIISTDSETSKQLRNQSTTIRRSTDSFIAKSEPVVNHYKRYTVDKLPTTPNLETKLLFEAISKSEDLFQGTSNAQTGSNDALSNVLVIV